MASKTELAGAVMLATGAALTAGAALVLYRQNRLGTLSSAEELSGRRDEPTGPAFCVFCGSSMGKDPAYAEAAEKLGRLMVEKGISLVYGGGSYGLMGKVAKAVDEAKGKVFGVIPHSLVIREAGYLIQEERVQFTRTMHMRKKIMSDMSDAFIALPGGYGTFEELMEMITWTQLNIHQKAVGILNINGFYDKFLEFIDHAIEAGLIRPVYRDIMVVEVDPERLVNRLLEHPTPQGIPLTW